LQFTKLRLTGFKSFVDPTELAITPGLTGVVGPNGCGKSNLVEALRWAMGETSAKQMRGGEMDDVIFGGTADRPSRNVAEVVIALDNSQRLAPAAFNQHDELEISRRIERDHGSAYRVNGQDVRARDVQLMFADLATGARSTALVSQGRVAALIGAKPVARRLLLEEAAGITGLHSRRHEAELRLRAALNNLERLDDVLTTLEGQLQGLRKQARQARRYRSLADHIRRSEAILLHLMWTAACGDDDAARAQLAVTEQAVAETTRAVAAATTAREAAAQALPPLRDAETLAAAELQRLRLAREGLDGEERRVDAARAAVETRLGQIADDVGREESLARDAVAAIARLGDERDGLAVQQTEAGAALEVAAERLGETNAAVEVAEAELSGLAETLAADEARHASLTSELGELTGRRARLAERRALAETERTELAARQDADDAAAAARTDRDAAESAIDTARGAHDTTEAQRSAAEAAEQAAREARQAAQETLGRLRAEDAALADLLADADAGDWTPLIDGTSVTPGYEAALAAALGEDLEAPEDTAAPRHWRSLTGSAAPALPASAKSLADFVKAPKTLARRLAQIGVVDAGEADRLAGSLAVGQRLVSRDGGLWRWDGFVVRPGAPDAAATRLKQRNRRAELWQELDAAEATASAAETRLDAARGAAAEAKAAERAARDALRAADAAAAEARKRYDELAGQATAAMARLDALTETLTRLDADLTEVDEREAAARDARDAIADLESRREDVARRRDVLSSARSAQADARAEHETLARLAEARRRRLAATGEEISSWQAREAGAGARVEELKARRTAAESELAKLAEEPARLAEQRASLLDTIAASETRRNAAADRLAEAETREAEAAKALKAREEALMAAREARIRAEGAQAQAEQILAQTRARIAERLDCAPDEALALAELKEGAELPTEDASRTRLERLLRERDNMGPVNLRAEQEADELFEQMSTMQEERDDLTKAIDRLRHGIGTLNREARQRLLASFNEVDRHFQELFTRLFGGGRAHLQLIDSDDPLEAGLEVFASPPGKRLQALSLLSGGEQALTALSLLFAVFLTNPAPICVLDEVDAPLDDANVDRFCTLLEDMARGGDTRFLLVTHHRMTMARMDRLYGVTMPERGVSRLVSVDLREATDIQAAEIAG